MTTKRLRGVLLFWCLFIGLGALAGGAGMLVDPTGRAMGMDAMLPSFQVLPFADALFQNFTFPGIALLCVNCVPNLIAAWLLLRKKRVGAVLGTVFGLTLMLWITIQFFIFEFNWLSTSYFIFGVAQLVTGHLLLICLRRDAFHFDPAEYPAIGTDARTLVVYFSRRGYVKKHAYEQAQACGGDLCELTTPERTAGFLGFAWCGRFAMHCWPMPLQPVTADVSRYERVILCAPIWAFSLCAPMRAFAQQSAGKVKRAEYVLVHYSSLCTVAPAVQELDGLLGVTHERATDVLCHCGQAVRIRALDAKGRALHA